MSNSVSVWRFIACYTVLLSEVLVMGFVKELGVKYTLGFLMKFRKELN